MTLSIEGEYKCRYLVNNNEGQEICFFLKASCVYIDNQRTCDIDTYYTVPGKCPNCDTFDSCNCIKARIKCKDRTIGWICKECFYYLIFPLNPLKVILNKEKGEKIEE